MQLRVDTSQAKKEFYKVRARFTKLQRVIIAEALLDASEPTVRAAQALAPVLATPKRGRQPGQLRGKIGPTVLTQRGALAVAVGAVRLSKRDKSFPFWDRFQELGFRAMGRANRRTAKRWTVVAGKHYLRQAGEQSYGQTEQIFAARIFQKFAEVEEAGTAAGLV